MEGTLWVALLPNGRVGPMRPNGAQWGSMGPNGGKWGPLGLIGQQRPHSAKVQPTGGHL